MFENISVKTALRLVQEGKAVLYDLREEASYRKGHLPMAKNRNKDMLEKELKIYILSFLSQVYTLEELYKIE